jgi:hypothetical protein
MANVQKYFETFHDVIRADYDMNSTLRDKRDKILDLLKRRLKEAGHPSCDGEHFCELGAQRPS